MTTRPTARPVAVIILAFLLLLILAAGLRIFVGSSSVGFPTGDNAELIFQARLFRLTCAVLVGSALALSGVSLQALLRNPLAEPFILGISSGAAMGVMLQLLLAFTLHVIPGYRHYGAVLGAVSSMIVVYAVGQKRGVIDPLGLLLTGVVLGTINGALIMLFQYMAGPGGLRDDLMQWMMGYLNESAGAPTVEVVAVVMAICSGFLLFNARAMDVATLSESEAMALGVNLKFLRAMLFIVASLLAAAAVVLAGPISFVGLICPHVARLVLGPRHGPLLIASALLGATLVLIADTTSSYLALRLGFGLMPIGIFTALLGGPIFLWMLRPQMGRGE